MLNLVLEKVTDLEKGIIAPRALGEFMHLEISAISKLSHINRNTLTRNPDSPRVQEALKPVVEILSIASDLMSSPEKAVVWFLHQPLTDFDYKTPQTLVEEGHADAVKAHLRMLSDGIYG